MAFEPWRYPGIFNLNQSASLPNAFGPPNMSQQLQSGISALADPILAKMKEEQARSELAKKAADTLAAFGADYNKPAGTTSTTASTGTTATPMRTSSTAGSPAGDDTGGAQGGGVQGTSTALLDASRRAIGTVESGGNYGAVGPATKSGDRAYGMFQVMGNNVGPWTEQHFGQRLTPQEFLKNPEAQEAVFRGQFGGYLDQYGNIRDAASKWFSGRPYAEAVRSGASDGYNRVDQYVAKVTQNLDRRLPPLPVPQPAPTASFAPQVAPAPTPQAAASVTAPSTPQQAPQAQQAQPKFTAPNVNMLDYQKEIYKALNAGDKQRASELAAERDQVAAQQRAAQRRYTADARADLAPEIEAAKTGSPEALNALERAAQERDRAVGAPQHQAGAGGFPQPQAPGPQSQAPTTPEQQQQAQQIQVLGNVAQTAAENDQRLDGVRQAGQRTRVASISPELPGLGLGEVMPGAAQPGPPAARPAPPSPAMAEPSFFSPEPMVTPQFAARPQTPAPSSPASAPAAPAGPIGPPPGQQPAGVPQAPYQVAQAQGLPPVVSVPQQQQVRPITREQARVLLNNATTPEEINRVALLLYQNQQAVQQQAAPTPNRFKIENGHWIDTLTGQTKPLEASGGGMFEGKSLEGQALNHLVATGKLSRDQAAQVAAGKQVTGSDGAIYWFRPQDLAGSAGGPGVMRQEPATPVAPGGAAPTARGAPAGATQLTAPKPDKPDNIPAEVAARIGLGNTFLENAPKIRKQVEDGALDSPKARAQLIGGYGDPGEIKRQIQSGKDALLRGLTGAGMGIQEAKDYVDRYEPSFRDDRRNILSKLDGLERDLKSVREGVLSGRRITDPALRGREGQSESGGSGGGGFTTPGGTFFKEVR